MKTQIVILYDTETKHLDMTRPASLSVTLEALGQAIQGLAAVDMKADPRADVQMKVNYDGRTGSLQAEGSKSPADRMRILGVTVQGIAENELRGMEEKPLIITASGLPTGLGR